MKSQKFSLKNLKMKPEFILGLVALAILLFGFYNYSYRNSSILSPMSSFNQSSSSSTDSSQANVSNNNSNASTSVSGSTSSLKKLSSDKPINNPSDLLPANTASEWAKMNPVGTDNLSGINLLSAQQQNGINTQGSSLRNANLQIRSEPPNPRNNTNCPWNISTIEGDTMRRPLEIGSHA